MFLPIIDVDIGNTTDKEFKLSLIKNINKVSGDKFMEPSEKRIKLLLDSLLDLPLRY